MTSRPTTCAQCGGDASEHLLRDRRVFYCHDCGFERERTHLDDEQRPAAPSFEHRRRPAPKRPSNREEREREAHRREEARRRATVQRPAASTQPVHPSTEEQERRAAARRARRAAEESALREERRLSDWNRQAADRRAQYQGSLLWGHSGAPRAGGAVKALPAHSLDELADRSDQARESYD